MSIFENITVDTEFFAVYAKIIKFTVTWIGLDGKVLKTESVRSGANATPPSNTTEVGYRFDKWDKTYTNITSDLIITAKYTRILTIVWKNWDDTVIKTETVVSGTTLVAPSYKEKPDHVFKGWDKSFENVLEDLVITAQFEYLSVKVVMATTQDFYYNKPTDYSEIVSLNIYAPDIDAYCLKLKINGILTDIESTDSFITSSNTSKVDIAHHTTEKCIIVYGIAAGSANLTVKYKGITTTIPVTVTLTQVGIISPYSSVDTTGFDKYTSFNGTTGVTHKYTYGPTYGYRPAIKYPDGRVHIVTTQTYINYFEIYAIEPGMCDEDNMGHVTNSTSATCFTLERIWSIRAGTSQFQVRVKNYGSNSHGVWFYSNKYTLTSKFYNDISIANITVKVGSTVEIPSTSKIGFGQYNNITYGGSLVNYKCVTIGESSSGNVTVTGVSKGTTYVFAYYPTDTYSGNGVFIFVV